MLKHLPRLKLSFCLIAFFSSAFQAFGMYNVHAVSGVTEGGILGLTLLMQNWFGISPSVSGFVMTAACFLLGWHTFGREFIGYSIIAASGFSLGYAVCELFPPLWPELAHMPLTAALVGALFIGLGAGATVRVGAATCGDDALAMSVAKLAHVEIQWVYLVSDLTVLGLSLTYIPFQRIVYSLLTVILSGQIVGWMQKMPLRRPGWMKAAA